MGLLLCIDTAQETASVCLAKDEKLLGLLINREQREHASWLHGAIQTILQEHAVELASLDAIAVSNGPGSYTGLRVGLAAAKGLCYALNIPLITLSTLRVMASAMQDKCPGLLCPLIDARRMEVYTAVYDKNLEEKLPPLAMILNETSFAEFLSNEILIFAGNGREKLQKLIAHPNAVFIKAEFSAANLLRLANKHLEDRSFADLAYAEPFYIKDFYAPVRKPLM
jgi:tRNA threonylcarbamoyladenosine biosynthesis protein TsaB